MIDAPDLKKERNMGEHKGWTEEKGLVKWLAGRMEEKSTYAGLGVLLSILLPNIPLIHEHVAEWANVITLIGTGLGGAAMLVLRENGSAH
jgi:hypothetical protein